MKLLNGNLNMEPEVINLFYKLKCHFAQSLNDTTNTESLTYFLSLIKLFNESKIDENELLKVTKTLLYQSNSELYFEFSALLNKIRRGVEKLKYHVCVDNECDRIDLRFMSEFECGPSYRYLPPEYSKGVCSGRVYNKISYEVLNDNYISLPSMNSEDSSTVSSKRNVHEDQMCRLEDERYEVDMHQEINNYALTALSQVQKKMDALSKEEKSKFQLDEKMGSTSAILMKKAIYRIYGSASNSMIEGLMAKPRMAIPLVISRMQEKSKEWSVIHEKFKLAWQDRTEKHFYLSFDHQGDWVKKDSNCLKRSIFVSQIESLSKEFKPINLETLTSKLIRNILTSSLHSKYDPDIHLKRNHNSVYGNVIETSPLENVHGPHISLMLPSNSILKEIITNVNTLLKHFIDISSTMTKDEKQEILNFIENINGFLFSYNDSISRENKVKKEVKVNAERRTRAKRAYQVEDHPNNNCYEKISQSDNEEPLKPRPVRYTLMLGNSFIYTFVRLYHILIDRLTILYIYCLKQKTDVDVNNENRSVETISDYDKVIQLLLEIDESNNDTLLNNEGQIRKMFISKTFLWFTIPKLLQQIIKTAFQVSCLGLESSFYLIDTFQQNSQLSIGGTFGTMLDIENYIRSNETYLRNAADHCLNQSLESFLIIYVKHEGRIMIQLLDTDDTDFFIGNISENESLPCKDVSEFKQEDRVPSNNLVSLYENFVEANGLKICYEYTKLFLMRNIRLSIKQLVLYVLDINQFEIIFGNRAFMEEALFLKVRKSHKEISHNDFIKLKEVIVNYLLNIFVGFGDLFQTAFYGTELENKDGFLMKKYAKKRYTPRTSLNEVILKLKK